MIIGLSLEQVKCRIWWSEYNLKLHGLWGFWSNMTSLFPYSHTAPDSWIFWNAGDLENPRKSPKFVRVRDSKPQKSPKFISSPSPKYPRNLFGEFRGYNFKKPQNQTYPHPQKIPKNFPSFIPIPAPSPKFGAGTGKIGDRGRYASAISRPFKIMSSFLVIFNFKTRPKHR